MIDRIKYNNILNNEGVQNDNVLFDTLHVYEKYRNGSVNFQEAKIIEIVKQYKDLFLIHSSHKRINLLTLALKAIQIKHTGKHSTKTQNKIKEFLKKDNPDYRNNDYFIHEKGEHNRSLNIKGSIKDATKRVISSILKGKDISLYLDERVVHVRKDGERVFDKGKADQIRDDIKYYNKKRGGGKKSVLRNIFEVFTGKKIDTTDEQAIKKPDDVNVNKYLKTKKSKAEQIKLKEIISKSKIDQTSKKQIIKDSINKKKQLSLFDDPSNIDNIIKNKSDQRKYEKEYTKHINIALANEKKQKEKKRKIIEKKYRKKFGDIYKSLGVPIDKDSLIDSDDVKHGQLKLLDVDKETKVDKKIKEKIKIIKDINGYKNASVIIGDDNLVKVINPKNIESYKTFRSERIPSKVKKYKVLISHEIGKGKYYKVGKVENNKHKEAIVFISDNVENEVVPAIKKKIDDTKIPKRKSKRIKKPQPSNNEIVVTKTKEKVDNTKTKTIKKVIKNIKKQSSNVKASKIRQASKKVPKINTSVAGDIPYNDKVSSSYIDDVPDDYYDKVIKSQNKNEKKVRKQAKADGRNVNAIEKSTLRKVKKKQTNVYDDIERERQKINNDQDKYEKIPDNIYDEIYRDEQNKLNKSKNKNKADRYYHVDDAYGDIPHSIYNEVYGSEDDKVKKQAKEDSKYYVDDTYGSEEKKVKKKGIINTIFKNIKNIKGKINSNNKAFEIRKPSKTKYNSILNRSELDQPYRRPSFKSHVSSSLLFGLPSIFRVVYANYKYKDEDFKQQVDKSLYNYRKLHNITSTFNPNDLIL